jgi:acetolactate synthase-1/2/3 large subunit
MARIVVVDDDELQLRAIQRTARRNPRLEVSVTSKPGGAAALVAETRPDVVVVDAYMPGVDGIELCRALKADAATRATHVVIASASMDDRLAREAAAAGASLTVTKPIDLSALLAQAQAVAPQPTITPARRRGADVLVSMLADAGVEMVFGLPGGAISPVHDALLDSPIRTITTRHENGAMFAAAGYAHATGQLAVVAVTSGPGFLNAMTGLASAWCDGLPILLLVGEVPRTAHGKGVLQDGSSHGLQLVEMARHVTKLAAEVPRPSALPHMVRRAIATAMSGRKGPVMLTLPLDVTTALISVPSIGGAVHMGATMDPATVDEVAELMRDAKRPLILAGSGVRGHGAPERLRTVAELLRCPVVTTPKAKGVFPESHPLALGVLGMGGHHSARDYLDSGVDVVLAIGTSLGDLATDGFAPNLQSQTLIHVDIDARQIGRSYEPTHAIVASAAELLGGLAERLESTVVDRDPIGGVARFRLASSTTPARIAPQDAIHELQQLLPADTIYTVDSGNHFMFATQFLETNHSDAFMVMTGLGSMGQSIGAAIGAQLAHPGRSVAAICGDGCFAMTAFEIATAVAERLPIRVFVFNDGHLGMVERGHAKVYGRQPDYPTGDLDVCAVARGLGAVTLRIDGPNQLREAHALLADEPGPVVFDVRIDKEVVLASRDRVASMNAPFTPSSSSLN